jgi:hypothetical protein
MCTTLEEGWKHLVGKRLDEIINEAGIGYFGKWPEREGHEHLAFQDEVHKACNAYLDAFLNYIRHASDVKHAVEIEIDKRWPRQSAKDILEKYYPSKVPR